MHAVACTKTVRGMHCLSATIPSDLQQVCADTFRNMHFAYKTTSLARPCVHLKLQSLCARAHNLSLRRCACVARFPTVSYTRKKLFPKCANLAHFLTFALGSKNNKDKNCTSQLLYTNHFKAFNRALKLSSAMRCHTVYPFSQSFKVWLRA